MEHVSTSRAESKSQRPRNPRGQGARLRDELVEAASTLLSESADVNQLTLRGVAKKVGIAATSVYPHFADVEQLAAAVAARCFAELNAATSAAGQGSQGPRDILLARCGAYCEYALAHPGHYRVMFQVERPDLAPTAVYSLEQSPGRPALDRLVQDIKRCQEAGLTSTCDNPTRLAVLVWAELHGLVILRLSRPRFPWPPLDELIDDAVCRLVGMDHRVAQDTVDTPQA